MNIKTLKIRNDIILLSAITSVGLSPNQTTVQVVQGCWMLYYECKTGKDALDLLNRVQKQWLKYLEVRGRFWFRPPPLTNRRVKALISAAKGTRQAALKK